MAGVPEIRRSSSMDYHVQSLSIFRASFARYEGTEDWQIRPGHWCRSYRGNFACCHRAEQKVLEKDKTEPMAM